MEAVKESAHLPGKSPASFHIPSLDGIRAASFFIVFLSHAGLSGIVPGYFGLTLFFFLSGYLITTLLRLEYDQTTRIDLKQFYWRRAFRILPPFYLVLAVASLLTALGFMGGSLEARAVLAQVCHVTNYYIVRHGWWQGLAPGTWVYWSLAVEEHFYLVFPLVYWSLRKRFKADTQAWLLFGLCVLVLFWRVILVFVFDAPKDRTYVASDTRVDAILAGCILAIWNNPVLDGARLRDRTLLYAWLPLGALMVAVSLLLREPHFEQTLRYSFQSFGLLPFFIAAVRFHDRGVFRLLNLRVVRYVGTLSYSLYLMHTSALWAAERWLAVPIPVSSVLTLLVLLVLAALIHRYIERPLGRLRRRWLAT